MFRNLPDLPGDAGFYVLARTLFPEGGIRSEDL
jgi:hypothetical protein